MGGAVKQPHDPPPFPNNSLWIKHLNQLLYPGKIINKQSDNKFVSLTALIPGAALEELIGMRHSDLYQLSEEYARPFIRQNPGFGQQRRFKIDK